MDEPYSVRVECDGGTTTIRLAGEIDLSAGPDMRAAVAGLVLGVPPTRVVLDLTDTTFVDSSGIKALLYARDAAARVGASMEVTSNPTVDRVLEVSGVAALLGSKPPLTAAR